MKNVTIGVKPTISLEPTIESDCIKVESSLIQVFENHGWSIKTGKEQLRGSCADIYAEFHGDIDEEFFYTLVGDGNVTSIGADVHIYRKRFLNEIYNPKPFDKIFEGVIEDERDLVVLFRMLGFKKIE